MKMRIIAAAVGLGLGLVGIALARQGGESAKPPATERVRLRGQVSKLRAEVELRQLEHDADVDFLKKLMADVNNLEGLEAAEGPMKEQVEALLKGPLKGQVDAFKRQLEGTKDALEKAQIPGTFEARMSIQEMIDQDFNQKFGADRATAKVARPLLERLKKEFVREAAELNEKRLELADVEKRYNEAK